MRSATAFAPATVANVAVGFDILGFAIESVGDIVTVSIADDTSVRVRQILNATGLSDPLDLPARCGPELRHGRIDQTLRRPAPGFRFRSGAAQRHRAWIGNGWLSGFGCRRIGGREFAA